MSGKITVYVGPMFAGKTTRMCTDVELAARLGNKCAIVKYSGDIRYDKISTNVVTHRGHEYSTTDIIKTSNIGDIATRLLEYDVIGIDEVQFYPDSSRWAQELAGFGKHIICAGLNGDYRAVPYHEVSVILSQAEKIKKLKAACQRCGKMSAHFTDRITIPADTTNTYEIGGADKYIAVCRKCKQCW